MSLNGKLKSIRKEFPVTGISFPVLGGAEKPLIYLDHAASTHPPKSVIRTHARFLERYYANIHRGNHNLSMIASDLFDQATEVLAGFIRGNLNTHAIVMTSNTTEALNLAAHVMQKQDGVALSTLMEHHSNDLPHRQRGKTLHVELSPDGSLDMNDLENKLKSNRVKLVAVTGASNVTGFLPDIRAIARLAHLHGAQILVDAAQLLAHHPIDVGSDEDPGRIDFLAAAGHKAYSPFGSAFLYGPRKFFDQADPFIPGGGTVVYVTDESVLYLPSPERHEGGTPNIAGTVAFSESIKFLSKIGMEKIREHERRLTRMAMEGLQDMDGIVVYGPRDPERRIGVITFNVRHLSHALVSAILNYERGIATRNGCFCAHPYIRMLLQAGDAEKFKEQISEGDIPALPGAVRVSFGIYNTEEEVEEFLEMMKVIRDRKWRGEYNFTPHNACQPAMFHEKQRTAGTQ